MVGSRYVAIADAIGRAAATLRTLEAGVSNVDSVKALLESRDKVVDSVGVAEGRYRAAGSALTAYATVLDRVQADTLRALHAAQAAAGDGADAARDQARYHQQVQDAKDAGDAEEQAKWEKKEDAAKADASHSSSVVAAQKQVVEQAVDDRDAAARTAIEAITSSTSNDGLNDSWWDDWGAKLTEWIAKIAEAIATIAGILALLLCWVPILGQVLLVIAAVAGIVAALANIILAATGEKSWGEAIMSVVFAALGCIGVGGALRALGGLAKMGLKMGAKTALKDMASSFKSLISRFRPGHGDDLFGAVAKMSDEEAAAAAKDMADGNVVQSPREPSGAPYEPPTKTNTDILTKVMEGADPLSPETYIEYLNPLNDLGPAWQQNCGPCSRAFVDTFHQVETRVAEGLPTGEALSVMEGLTGTSLKALQPAAKEALTDFTTRAFDAVKESAAGLPDGSALIIGVRWEGGGGHWFNGFTKDGQLHWADPQSGLVGGWPPDYPNILDIVGMHRPNGTTPWKEIGW